MLYNCQNWMEPVKIRGTSKCSCDFKFVFLFSNHNTIFCLNGDTVLCLMSLIRMLSKGHFKECDIFKRVEKMACVYTYMQGIHLVYLNSFNPNLGGEEGGEGFPLITQKW